MILAADDDAPDGFVAHRLPRPPGVVARITRRPARRALPGLAQADLVHLTSTLPFAAPAQISTCFDLLPLRFPALELGTGRVAARRRYNDYLDRLSAARLVVVPTAAVAADLSELLAIPDRRIRVVPLAAPAHAPPDASGAIGPTVLVVANREPFTNADLAIRAVATSDPAAGITLIVAGVADRRRRDRLRRHADGLGLAGRVDIHGPLGANALDVLRGRASIAAVPSRAGGADATVLAAMSAGLPIIAGDGVDLDETLASAAMRVPVGRADAWGDAISALAADPALRTRMAAASRARAAERSWGDVLREVRSAWTEATDG